MILAIARAMTLNLLRDRAALAMILVLPSVIYVVFAAIFASVGAGEPLLRVGLTASVPAPDLEAAMRTAPLLSVVSFGTEPPLRQAVAEGRIDAGLVLRAAPDQLDLAPIEILVDPAKPMAGAVLDGRIHALLGKAMPEVVFDRQSARITEWVGALDSAQSARLAAIRSRVATGDGTPPPGLTVQKVVGGTGTIDPAVTYYAGAIAFMFLLFSATQGATFLIDARASGLLDRVMAGPGGVDVAVLGLVLFLTVHGIVQVAVIFAVAAVLYGVPVASHLPVWSFATLLAAAAAAGFGLAVAAVCRTRAQAQAVSTFLVLLFSALGGSMVPRFLMPDWLREAGTVSPNAWAVDLYQGLLSRGASIGDLWAEAAALGALSVAGVGIAIWASRRRMLL